MEKLTDAGPLLGSRLVVDDDSFGVMTLGGVVTVAAAQRAARWMQAEAPRLGLRGLVLRIGHAVLAVDVDELCVVRRAMCWTLPVALVGAPAQLPLLRDFALRMAHAGYFRGVFVDVAPAMAWVRGKAELLERVRVPL